MRCLLLCIWWILLSAAGLSQKRYALLIGNKDYKGEERLNNPIRDVELVARGLVACHFDTTILRNADMSGIKMAVKDLVAKARDSRNGTILLYYSGHGVLDEGRTYLVPIGAGMSVYPGVKDGWIDEGWIYEQLGGLPTKFNVVLLDACRKPAEFSVDKPKSLGAKTVGVAWTPQNSFIMYSASPNQAAKDGDGQNSEFAKSVAMHIAEPNSTIESVFRQVKNDVYSHTRVQTPWATTTLGSVFFFTESAINEDFRRNHADGVIKIRSDAPCIVLVNGDTVRNINDTSFFPWTINEGYNEILAISKEYSDVTFTGTIYATPEDLMNNLLEVIPMALIVKQRKVLPALNSIVHNNWQLVAGGNFQMGQNNGNNDERPTHEVHLRSYYIKRYEVSQDEWEAVMNSNPSIHKSCAECPVENVSWNDAILFIRNLNQMTQGHYRLPTEAEWEFAARGGTLGSSSSDQFSGSAKLEKAGWYLLNSGGNTHSLGERSSNVLGIFDMSGNVAEWCSDGYNGSGYRSSKIDNPIGSENAVNKVVRGGSWNDYDQFCRVFSREKHPVQYKDKSIGIRLVKDAN